MSNVTPNVLSVAADHAARYLDQTPSRPIAATATIAELRQRLARPLPEEGTDATAVIDELVRDTEGGLMGSTNGRFFGWVIAAPCRSP